MEGQRKRVRLYALSTCGSCKKIKQFLDSHAVAHEYIEVDLLDSGEQWATSREMKRYNPSGSYPTVVVEEVIKGYDEESLKSALGIR